jgi:hypothetical protein
VVASTELRGLTRALAIMEGTSMFKLCTALLATLLPISGSVIASPNVYEVSASIKQNGQSVAAPRIRVKPNAPAEVSVAGDNRFRLAVIIIPSETDGLDVSVEVDTSQASLKSVVTTFVDKPIVVSSGDLEVTVTVADGDS